MTTKNDEIALLRECAAKLGNNSYCGPWLAQVLPEIEAAIRSDFMPQVSLAETATLCRERIAQAEEQAARILADAKARAESREKEMDNRVSSLVREFRRRFEDANAMLCRF